MADLTDEEIQQFFDDEDPDLDKVLDVAVRAVNEIQRNRPAMKRLEEGLANAMCNLVKGDTK